MSAIPVGATLSDGTHTFTASASTRSVDVSQWQRDRLSLIAPLGYTGTFTLQVTATATETANGDSQSTSLPLTVSVLPTNLASPIILDLNGDGVQTLDINATEGRFDLLNTGTAIRSGWISKEDAFLAIDTNGNGVIDDRSELFGGEVGDGFAKLASFDSNGDGQVDKNDARFSELRLWQDCDSDHQTDAGELQSLIDARIAALSVSYHIRAEQQNGNWILERSTATTTDGRSIDIADAYFQVEAEQVLQHRGIIDNPAANPGMRPPNTLINGKTSSNAEARITVQSVLPVSKPFTQPGTAPQSFAQRSMNHSSLINQPWPLMWLDAAGNIKDESREFEDTFEQDGQEVAPVINWHRDSAKERKHAERKTTPKSDKQRVSDWVSGFVNAADDHAKQAKRDALRITLPATVTTKGK